MKIAWYGPNNASHRQQAALCRIFGDALVVEFRGAAGNAAMTVADFRRSGADEAVMVAPLAVLEHILREGLRPLWTEAEAVEANHPEAEWIVKGQWFRFVEFKRLVALGLHTENPKPLTTARPARVAWLTRHRCEAVQLAALQDLYGPDVAVIPQTGELRGPREVADALGRINATDCVLVAPLSLFAALTMQAIHPLRSVMSGLQFMEFRRVTGLDRRYEPVRSTEGKS